MYISLKRSIKANYFEYITWKSKTKEKYMIENKFKAFLEERRIENEKEYILPEIEFIDKVYKEILFEREVFTISCNFNSKTAILYLHGGAYVNKANIHHFVFADNITKKLDVDFVLPLYPLAPNCRVTDSHVFLEKLYNFLSEKYNSIILMGDSAGGGLAYGLLKYMGKNINKIPKKIITFSPWVDLSMKNNDIKKYEKTDPMLSRYGLSEIGKIWSNENLYDEKASVAYTEDMSMFNNSYIFVGTREIFYPDVMLFYNKIKNNGLFVKSYIFNDMNHIFPLVSNLPEAVKAQEIVIKLLKE